MGNDRSGGSLRDGVLNLVYLRVYFYLDQITSLGLSSASDLKTKSLWSGERRYIPYVAATPARRGAARIRIDKSQKCKQFVHCICRAADAPPRRAHRE